MMQYKRHTKEDYEEFLNNLFPTDYILRKFKYMLNTSSDLAMAAQGNYGTLLKKYDIEFFIQGYKHWVIMAEFQEYKAKIRNKDRHVMSEVRIPTKGKMHYDLDS